MEYLRPDDVLMQFLNEELVLYVKCLNEYNQHVDIIRVVFALIVPVLDTWMLDDPTDEGLDDREAYFLGEVLLISVELGVGLGLAELEGVLVEEKDGDVFVDRVLVLGALLDQPINEVEADLEDFFVFLF